jgi:hypothetical protein
MIIGVEALVASMLGSQAVESLAELAPLALLGCAAVGLVVSWARSSPGAGTRAAPRRTHRAPTRRQYQQACRNGVQSATLPWPPS